MKTVTAVSPVMNTLPALVSKFKIFRIQSTKDSEEDRWWSPDSSVPFQFSRNNSSATETVTATATVKNQKTSLWFMCYKSVQ
jgi:hypothetical protein